MQYELLSQWESILPLVGGWSKSFLQGCRYFNCNSPISTSLYPCNLTVRNNSRFRWPLTLWCLSQDISIFSDFVWIQLRIVRYCASIWNQHGKCIKISTKSSTFGPVVLEVFSFFLNFYTKYLLVFKPFKFVIVNPEEQVLNLLP